MSATQHGAARRKIAVLCTELAHTPKDAAAAYEAAELAIDNGLEDLALPAVARAAQLIANEPRLWQMLALLHRGVEQSDAAIAAFSRAARLSPRDVRIAHGLALSTMEAGLPAVERYNHALRLAPHDGTLLLGRASALAAERQGDRALESLARILRENPGWIDGHRGYAKLCATMGVPDRATETLAAAIILRPRDITLHLARLAVLARTVEPARILQTIADARQLVGNAPALVVEEAIAASEAGDLARADRLFSDIGTPTNDGLALAQLRHLIRAQRFEQADTIAAMIVAGPEWVTAWAYRATAWRLLDDPRLDWLEQDGALLQVSDITDALPPLDQLASVLRALHVGIAQPLDQSVRGGTQTEGPLFSRVQPEIRKVREAIRSAVGRYIAALPPPDPTHPLLSAPRGSSPRFAGSWSVRLRGAGQHANHIHGYGWLSSALYIALPDAVTAGRGGQLTIGSPPAELGLDAPPTSIVYPRPGRLALFPSYTWHGVTSFDAGERLTIAFDVSRPQG